MLEDLSRTKVLRIDVSCCCLRFALDCGLGKVSRVKLKVSILQPLEDTWRVDVSKVSQSAAQFTLLVFAQGPRAPTSGVAGQCATIDHVFHPPPQGRHRCDITGAIARVFPSRDPAEFFRPQ